MKYRSTKRKEKKKGATFLFGILFNCSTFLVLLFLASLILSRLKNPLGASGIASFLTLMISAAVSGFTTAKKSGTNTVLPSGLCAIFFSSLLFALAMILCKGSVKAVTAINLLVYVAVAFIFAAFAKKKKRRVSSNQPFSIRFM